jgi:hypothetical protein
MADATVTPVALLPLRLVPIMALVRDALVVLPVFYFYFRLLTATEKSDFSRIQRMLKWLMVSGILSVVLV